MDFISKEERKVPWAKIRIRWRICWVLSTEKCIQNNENKVASISWWRNIQDAVWSKEWVLLTGVERWKNKRELDEEGKLIDVGKLFIRLEEAIK